MISIDKLSKLYAAGRISRRDFMQGATAMGVTIAAASTMAVQAEDGIRDSSTSRGLGDVYKRQAIVDAAAIVTPIAVAPCIKSRRLIRPAA